MSAGGHRNAQIKAVKRRLIIGQPLYLAPWDSYMLEGVDTVLEPAVVEHIPSSGGMVKIIRGSGITASFGVNQYALEEFCLGSMETRDEKGTWLVFLNGDQFWRWRRLRRLAVALVGRGLDERMFQETENGLKAAQIIYDIFENQNADYQNMSCSGCLRPDRSDTSICASCIRFRGLPDRWRAGGVRT